MAFRFGLSSVLRHRQRLEEIAQRDFAEAQGAVDEVLRRLEDMYQRLDEVRSEIGSLQFVSGKENLELIRAMEAFIEGHKIRIERLRQDARGLLQKAEEMQELLLHASKEKKVLVKLREKRLQEYQEWLGRIETKNQDEQTMMRHRWRKK